jgi:hypothetical protein
MSGARLGKLVSQGPRAQSAPDDYRLIVEAVYEGYLLHYGQPPADASDPDFALLSGDELYARGLARLAALGDLEAVAELADAVSLSAQAQAEQDPARAEAIWEEHVRAIGWGRE